MKTKFRKPPPKAKATKGEVEQDLNLFNYELKIFLSA